MRAAFAQLRGHCLAQRFGLCQRGRRPARAGAHQGRAQFRVAPGGVDVQLRAIEAGDPVAARAAAAQHMKNALARIEQADLSFWAQDGARLAQPLVAASTPLVF